MRVGPLAWQSTQALKKRHYTFLLGWPEIKRIQNSYQIVHTQQTLVKWDFRYNKFLEKGSDQLVMYRGIDK